jgi:hypothetical protein
MVDSRSSGRHVRARNESPLFCTPSADEVPIDLDRLFDDGEEEEDVGSPAMPDVVDDSPVPICHPTYPQSSQPTQKKGPRVLACFPLDLASAGPVYSDTQLLAADLWGCDNMAPTGSSLTSFVDPFNGISATERNHLPRSKTGQPHLETLISPKTTSTSSTTGNPKPSQNLQSVGSFTGYATREDEEESERPPVRPPKKAHPKKSTVYKSAEVIASSSGSDSDLGHSQSPRFPLQRTAPAKLSKQSNASSSHRSLTAGKPNRNPPSEKRSKMAYDRRGNGNGSASKKSGIVSQKRPRSPTAMIANKRRPNTKGGFVVDDSESEVEEQHSQIEDEDDIRLKSVSPKPLPKQPPIGRRNESKPISMMQYSLGLEPGVTPLPTKQVNRSRINALLGKNKGAQNTPKQGLQLTQAGSSNTKPRVSALPDRPLTASTSQHQTSAKTDGIRTDVVEKKNPPEMQRTTKGMEGLSQRSTASGTPGTKPNMNREASPNPEDARRFNVLERQFDFAADLCSITTIPDKPGNATPSGQKSKKPALSQAIAISKGKNMSEKMQVDDYMAAPQFTAHRSAQSEFLDPIHTERNKPIPRAKVARELANGMASSRPSQASPPKSLLQAALDDARHTTTTVTPGQAVDASGKKNPDVRKDPSVLTTSTTQKAEHGPQPRTGDRHIPSSSDTQPPRTPPVRKSEVSPVTQSMSKNQTPSAKMAKPIQPQHQRAGGASIAKTPQSNARSGPTPSSKPTPAQLAQPAQKRKADNISGGPGYAATLSKKPAVAHARPPVRPTNTQAQPKGATALTAADSTPKALARTGAEKPSTSTRPAADAQSSSRLAPSLVSKSAINESCSVTARHDPLKQQNVHAAAPADERTSLGVARQTQISLQQETFSGVTPANSTPQKPRPASDKAAPGQATPLVPQKGPATEALTSSKETRTVGAAPSFDQSVNDRQQAGVDSSQDRHGEGSSGGELAPNTVSANTSKSTFPAATAIFPYKSSAVPISPSGNHEQKDGASIASSLTTLSTVTPEAESSMAYNEYDDTHPATATNSISTKTSDAIKPASSGLSVSAKFSDDDIQSPDLPRPSTKTMNDPAHCNITSLEARKKSKVSQEDEDKATPDAAVTADTTSNAEPSTQTAGVAGGTKASPNLVANSMSFPRDLPKKPKIVLTPPLSPSVASTNPTAATKVEGDTMELSHSPEISSDAQPFFEYSVFQKMWSGEQIEKDVTAAEVTVCSFINIDEANAQAERLFQGSKNPYAQYLLVEWSNKRDEFGCSIFIGTIAPFDYPAKKSHLKIYVQRNCVSRFANQTLQALKGTGFISSTGYALRLFKLISTSDAENSDDSDAEDDEGETRPPIRAFEPHSRSEYYTTREAANRAARSLQIELSHEKNPTDVMTKAFQEKNLTELNAKVLELESSVEGEDGCWKSKFNASGLGGDSLELVVEKVEICGPRNI